MSINVSSSSSSSGISFLGALTLLFIAFKVSNIITWSWWWGLAPLWIPAAIVIIILIMLGLILLARK